VDPTCDSAAAALRSAIIDTGQAIDLAPQMAASLDSGSSTADQAAELRTTGVPSGRR
jgi:hypothetical protein